MGLHDLTTLHFFLAATQCHAQLPVMTDNERMVVAQVPPSPTSILWEFFQTLESRLGSDWISGTMDCPPLGRFVIIFQKTDFSGSAQVAFSYHLKNLRTKFRFIEYKLEHLGSLRENKADFKRKVLSKDMIENNGETNDKDGDGEGVKCVICFKFFSFGEVVDELRCEHWFHSECIGQWLNSANTCPLCRQGVENTQS